MGNGSSQSIALGPPRYNQQLYPSPQRPKYAHPHNRVLPLPVAGQRLRTTDNGSILQAAGTIRGHKGHEDFTPTNRAFSNGQQLYHDDFRRSERDHGDFRRTERSDHDDFRRSERSNHPYAEDFSRRRTSMEDDSYPNLRNHRMFHSDPNIASRRPGDSDSGLYNNNNNNNNNRRSYGGGAAARVCNMKYKKKTRAPEPPPSMNSVEKRREEVRNKKNMSACKCIAKTRAPQPPPAIVVHPPPPPPPLPSELVTTRTSPQTLSSQQSSKSFTDSSSSRPTSKDSSSAKSPTVTRGVECKTSYEKKVHPLEKWRNCRSVGDVRIDEGDEEEQDEGPHQGSRTTVFDSRKITEKGRIPSYLPQGPDPFQKEIQAVTKKIAQSRQQTKEDSPKDQGVSGKVSGGQAKTSSPPKFYFADPTVFKTAETTAQRSSRTTDNPGVVSKSDVGGRASARGGDQEEAVEEEVASSLHRFSPTRRRVRSPSQQQKRDEEWEHLSKSMYHDSGIDVSLRPVLPRKPPENLPKFSSSEAWQALGSDGLGSSNHSTSDDGRLSPYKRANLIEDRQRRFSDIDHDRQHQIRNSAFQHRSLSDSHWTPRQDLMDDSDVTSENTSDEEAVVPRLRTSEISTRFSLPTVMFSNMRPIGTEVKSNPAYMSDGKSSKQTKKKLGKRVEDYDGGNNFRRFLTKKNKYQSEEDITVSDSNWTFGQTGLQKRGKQYSSELLLSDKKRYELMDDNFGDFLGDILMSKSNHVRNQMKSSDSGNSNFSFYSTEGQVMYAPDKRRFVTEEVECPPSSKGRVYDIRKRFDANLASKSAKKKAAELEVGRRRDLELAKMLEDEVRRRRNKEKIGIRQQLQKMKHHLPDEEEDFDDEAYFTEPKSREEDESPPFFQFGLGPELGFRPTRYFGQGSSVTAVDSSSSRLTHWQSSPALLEDSMMKNGLMQSSAKGRLSLSSVTSSPETDSAWVIQQQSSKGGVVDSWLTRQQLKSIAVDRMVTAGEEADVSSSSPSPAAVVTSKKERRTSSVYKQLMDIVRKEERQLKKAQGIDPTSRDSSYSHRESSPSTTSESSCTSSYSDSNSGHARNGVNANKEFGYRQHSTPAFHVLQPYSASSKAYRPVAFESGACRLPGLQEEGKHLRTQVS